MPEQFIMPASPSYYLHGGLPVYYVQAMHCGRNPSGWLPSYFILHDTDGTDSRQELFDSSRHVSVHYVVGMYPGLVGPVVVKFLSEVVNYSYGAGYGTIGGVSRNLNELSIQFEIEYASMSEATMSAYAVVVASSLAFWSRKGADVRFLLHKDIDARKKDPRFKFQDMMRRVYNTLPLIP